MNCFTNGVGYCMVLKNKIGYKIEKSCPYNSLIRRQNFCRYDGSNGVGGVVKSIDVVKYQS